MNTYIFHFMNDMYNNFHHTKNVNSVGSAGAIIMQPDGLFHGYMSL